MTQQEYEQKKMECWHHLAFNYHRLGDIPKAAFDYIFDRAYTLGKQKETITLGEIEKAWQDYAKEIGLPESLNYASKSMIEIAIKQAFRAGTTLNGKQEKNADPVIQGWVAIDEAFNQCFLHTEKPIQKAQPIADTGDYDTVWDSEGKTYLLDNSLFPDMDSDSEPEEVELIIKRKKKNL